MQGILAVFLLIMAAGPKLLGDSDMVEMFDDLGAGQWFRYFVGAVELAGVIGLVIPVLAGLAALGLSGVLLGAVVTQLFVLDEPSMAPAPAVLAVLMAVIAWARRAEIQALVTRLRR
ncbi:DoxX family protein [Streptomyces sp. NPDC096311]|uniref:DoxX family protein n=1 Tax=Streptomyces sp. NPDC096311 TaxID=3366083 RepID=UPI003807FF03